jgi:four helix bundle protein
MNNEHKNPHMPRYTTFGVWKEGHQLVIEIYRCTKNFPKDEQFGLISQMRRAAVSVTSNIAEGYGRKGKAEKIQFYYIARGSLTELENQLMIARDVGYIESEKFLPLARQTNTVAGLLNSFIENAKSYAAQ